MKTFIRCLIWPLLVILIVPTALGMALAGCLVWLFDDSFAEDDGWTFFLSPIGFLVYTFPLWRKK